MRLLKITIGTILVLATSVPVAAGDVNQKGELGLFTLRSGYTYGKGVWGFSLYGNEWDWRVGSDQDFEDFDPLWSNWDLRHRQVSAGFGVGLTDRIELDVALPFYETYDADESDGDLMSVGHLNGRVYNNGRIDQEGLGDVRVGLRFGLINTDTSGLSLNLTAGVPTGDDDEGVVTGEWGYGVGLGWTRGKWTFNGGYWDPGDPDIVQEVKMIGLVDQGVSPRVEVGLGYAQPFGDRWDWITELSGDITTESTGEYDHGNLASGGRYHFGDEEQWAFNFGLRVDVSHNEFDDADGLGGLIGITYSPVGRLTGSGDRGGRRAPDAPPPPPVAPPAPGVAPPSPPVAASTHGLTVRKAGTGNGVVTSNPAGIDCGSDCRETYPAGTQVRLSGTPDACSTLTGFGGDCASDGSATMSSDRTCTATFDARRRAAQTFDACEKYGAWDCQSGLRETVPFATGTAVLAENAAGDGRGVLCDWANQLRACPSLRLCVAGSNAASEDACVATERADALVEFFRRQSGEDAFSGIASRVQAAPSCSPEDEKGSVGNLLLR